MPKKVQPTGTDQERELFSEVMRHYALAKEDLLVRTRYFDKVDELFRSHIVEANWPYQSTIFDPRVFTSILEKTSRLLANKPKGRLVPRESGDALGAKISNEVLDFQWEDNQRVDAEPMLAKWASMDQNARKYGASFGLVKWQYQTTFSTKDDAVKTRVFFDGPTFKPLVNRDCLPNPAYSSIKNWFQYRDYLTIQELQSVNDAAKSKPVYKNLDILVDKIKKDKRGGDMRSTNYYAKDLSIKHLQDFMGRDEVFKVVEIITEYRDDRWITFCPRYGVVIRDIDNPYDHKQIPVVLLKYYPVDDDLYGLSEVEPIEKLQRAVNALWSQYVDAINMSLYTPMKVRSTGVQMHTLEFGPGKKWLMNDPISDVLPFDQAPTGVQEFATTYRLLVNAMNEGLGQQSSGVSSAVPGQDTKTATEIVSNSMQQNARDNFNQIFLGEALKKQMLFWHKMNQQFMFSGKADQKKVIRIAGKDAIRYFQNYGLASTGLSDQTIQMLASPELDGVNIDPATLQTPNFPVDMNGKTVTKMSLNPGGDTGELIVEPDDLAGDYDYIPDVGTMQLPNQAEVLGMQKQLIELAQNPITVQLLQQEGYSLKFKELLEDFLEDTGVKDADKYFEKAKGGMNGSQQPTAQQANPFGAAATGGQQASGGVMQPQGMGGDNQAFAGGQNQPLMGGSIQSQG